jgi:hypothetical protein
MRESSPACLQYTTSSEPPSACGLESTETGRTVEDTGAKNKLLMCFAMLNLVF